MLIPRRHFLSAIGGVSLLAASLPSPALAETQDGEHGPQGTWDVTVTFQDGPRRGTQEKLQAYIGPETFAVRSTQAASFLLVGWGTWSPAGDRAFRYTFREVNLEQNQIQSLIHVMGLARLSVDTSSFDAVEEGSVYLLNGQLFAATHTTSHAVRVL